MPLVDELVRVLGYPRLRFPPNDQRAMVADVLRIAELVDVRTEVDAIPDDPDDNRVLARAVDGKAGAIVTGDVHLLNPGGFRGIPILRGGAHARHGARLTQPARDVTARR